MRYLLLSAVAICCIVHLDSYALQAPTSNELEADRLYYVTGRKTSLYRDVERSKPYVRLAFREPVTLLAPEGSVMRVRTMDGATGYVREDEVSNIWILVSKRRKLVTLHRGLEVVSEYRADFGYNAYSDKEILGTEGSPDHWRTPEGAFYVVRKNPYSQFHRAFLLNYPNAEDAARGLRDGLINQHQFDTIMQSERRGIAPPMGTPLGGMIEIHGHGTGLSSNWTQGCVAVRDEDMDFMWTYVREGTPVVIEK